MNATTHRAITANVSARLYRERKLIAEAAEQAADAAEETRRKAVRHARATSKSNRKASR